jgi:hypothetical protein
MAKLRNPRFAPEALERRLHPTVMIPISAEVYCMDDPEPLPDPNGPGEPPPTPPILPGGPSGPY